MTLAASLLIMDSMLLSEPELTSAFQLLNIYFVYLNVFYWQNLGGCIQNVKQSKITCHG